MWKVFSAHKLIDADDLGEGGGVLALAAAKFTEVLSASITCLSPQNQQIVAQVGKSSAPSGGDTLTPTITEGGTPANTATGGYFVAAGVDPTFSEAHNALGGWQYRPEPEERECLSPGDYLTVETVQEILGGVQLLCRITWRERG